ncbi:hypothetical protein BDY24DRAFT_99416 [Mrakia frigida]|uniref:uncharacterized protein n=1 Tax=Mrakia frigida TaxID=29902 RepID=UPI003FCBF944
MSPGWQGISESRRFLRERSSSKPLPSSSFPFALSLFLSGSPFLSISFLHHPTLLVFIFLPFPPSSFVLFPSFPSLASSSLLSSFLVSFSSPICLFGPREVSSQVPSSPKEMADSLRWWGLWDESL